MVKNIGTPCCWLNISDENLTLFAERFITYQIIQGGKINQIFEMLSSQLVEAVVAGWYSTSPTLIGVIFK